MISHFQLRHRTLELRWELIHHHRQCYTWLNHRITKEIFLPEDETSNPVVKFGHIVQWITTMEDFPWRLSMTYTRLGNKRFRLGALWVGGVSQVAKATVSISHILRKPLFHSSRPLLVIGCTPLLMSIKNKHTLLGSHTVFSCDLNFNITVCFCSPSVLAGGSVIPGPLRERAKRLAKMSFVSWSFYDFFSLDEQNE